QERLQSGQLVPLAARQTNPDGQSLGVSQVFPVKSMSSITQPFRAVTTASSNHAFPFGGVFLATPRMSAVSFATLRANGLGRSTIMLAGLEVECEARLLRGCFRKQL